MQQLEGTSLDIKTLQLEKLKETFPEAVAEGKIDWEKLKLTLGEDLVIANERYVLNWAGKSDAFRAIQTTTTATLKPQNEQSVNCSAKGGSQPDRWLAGASGGDTTENIFIEGENLEVLKVLQKSYYGRVKMIYIDPPYNTGNDSFIYPDKFSESKEEYLKRIGDKDEAGYLTKEGLFRRNSKESGQYHSNWLSMMYPRLFLARNLLRDDGVIFVSIDDNEVHNLRLMMNEIFGEENFIAQFVWEGAIKNDSKFASVSHDYIVCFCKSKMYLTINETIWRTRKEGIDRIYEKVKELKDEHREDYDRITTELKHWYSQLNKNDSVWSHRHYSKVDSRGVYFPGDISWPGGGGPGYEVLHPVTKKPVRIPASGWRFAKPEGMQKAIDENRIDFGENENKVPTLKRYLHEIEGQVLPSVIYKDRRAAMQRLRQILEGDVFENPKDEAVLMKLMEATTNSSDIILDFFAGSGTTAQAVMELNKENSGNRKFILVQLPEKTEEDSEAYKAGYKTIADICKERIRRVTKKIKKEIEAQPDLFKDKSLDLGFKVFTLEPSNFKVWRTDVIETEEELKKQMEAFVDPVRAKSEVENMAWEIAVKSGYEEFTLPMRKIDIGETSLYSLADGELLLALTSLKQEAITKIIEMKPKKFICLDRLFAGNDQLKTNTALQMKDAGVQFRTI